MIEDDAEDGSHDAAFARSYDFFKHMTGVALVSLGGVFAFIGGGELQFNRRTLVVVLVFIGLAGVTSFLTAGGLAALEVKPEPRARVVRRVRIAHGIVGVSLSIGLGAFIYNFTAALLR